MEEYEKDADFLRKIVLLMRQGSSMSGPYLADRIDNLLILSDHGLRINEAARKAIGLGETGGILGSIEMIVTISKQRDQLLARIKRLEEAGDVLEKWCASTASKMAWNQAKEAKP
jgi:hypothetical protein